MYYNKYRLLFTGAGSYDADAQAYFTATGITDNTQKSAINTLVLAFKSYNIWTKMTAVYPFVGGTSSTHSYNLKNSATFQITWSGSLTHDSNGILSGGGVGFTGIIPLSHLSLNSVHAFIYSKTNTPTGSFDFGCGDGSSLFYGYITAGGSCQILMNDVTGTYPSISDSSGGFLCNRSGSNAVQVYRNGSSIHTSSVTSTSLPTTYQFAVAGLYDSGSIVGSSKVIAFTTVGSSLSSTEASNMHTAVQAFQTSLLRNI